MANSGLTNENSTANSVGEVLPIDPFRSLYVHFGMLLGVEDFRTVDAYHRGKMWFHNSWLHRHGTIWGLKVSLDAELNEVRVAPGAAVDGLGRELYLQQAACLNLNAWHEKHKDDPELTEIIVEDEESGALTFSGHVVIEFKACLNRQVPALTEPCDGSDATTAYSRVVETVELHLIPGLAPEWRAEAGQLPFHRVRLLFGLDMALVDEEGVVIDSDQDVLDARANILALPGEQQAAEYLRWLRHFSAFDEMELKPALVDAGDSFSLLPENEPHAIPLANLQGITLLPTTAGWILDAETVTVNRVDNTIRPVHIPTSTIQELVCGPAMNGAAAPPAEPLPTTPGADAGGPRIAMESVEVDGEFIRFTIEGGPLMKASVDARVVKITAFDNRDGWVTAEVKKLSYEQETGVVTAELRDAPGGNLVRLIVSGTGSYPMMGRNRIPLAGAVGGAPGTKFDGNDFVSMLRIRS